MLEHSASRYSVAFVVGFLKGKSAIRVHREWKKNRPVAGKHFWTRGYCVSTVGLDEKRVRAYIRHQEESDKQQGDLFDP